MFEVYVDHEKGLYSDGNLRNKIDSKMETSFNHTASTTYIEKSASTSIFSRFFKWCAGQEPNKFMWVGIALAAHGCILTPITVMVVLMSGANMLLFMLAIVAMGITLVTNLAAMPTKVTIPLFVFSILIDIVIVIAALSMGVDIAKTYI